MLDLKTVREISKDLTILYVEDEESIRFQLEKILKLLFKEVIVAVNGADGLEKYLSSNEVDIIITDVQMPKLNGLEMAEKIKAKDREQHIIIVSAHNEINYFVQAIDIGIDGFIVKPVRNDKLLETIYKSSKIIKEQKENRYYQENLEELLEEKTKELENNLVTDELTGLYNKVKLNSEMSRDIDFTIILVNIDNFDHINTTYGYDLGDEVLKQFAKLLLDAKPENAKLFRLASDEMVYVFEKLEKAKATEFAEMLNALVEQSCFEINDVCIELTCTVGIADGNGREALVMSHIAMKEIREIGKNRFFYFTNNSSLQKRQKNNIEWMKKVKNAIAQNTIIPYYQPIINNESGKIEKYECLARIIETSKVISPNYFIEPARLVGLIPSITKTMIEKSFKNFSNREGEFSINITENDLKDGFLVNFLEEMSKEYNIKPERVVLEILENISAIDSENATEQLNDLKFMGYKLAIDDFGSEKSNFFRLQQLNVDFIKIDGMFIKDIHKNENSYQIAKTIADMAKNLGAKTIAEYVHNEEVFQIVKDLGIDYSQGFLFGEPKEII